jgi:putative intracellular protease/amidase
MTADAPPVLALVADLMDRSRVTAALGDGVELVATAGHLRDRLTAGPDPEVVLVDLGRRGILDALPGIRAQTGARIIGFGAHVERDLLAAARDAGCDQVVARSVFFARLPELTASR